MTGNFVETDSRGRAKLAGYESRSFLMRELTDGCVLLIPITIDAATQAEYDTTAELRQSLAVAIASSTVTRRTREPG